MLPSPGERSDGRLGLTDPRCILDFVKIGLNCLPVWLSHVVEDISALMGPAALYRDARKGHHLWAEKYDRELKDIFALQDEITMKIITALEVKLTEGEQARLYRRGTDNIEAYVKALKAIEYHERFNKDDMVVARRMCEEAMALDPEYARPYRVLAMTHLMEPFYGTSTSPRESMERALELAKKAISLDDSHPCGYEVLSYIYLMKRQYEKAIAEAERAIAVDPNGADSHVALGAALSWAGRRKPLLRLRRRFASTLSRRAITSLG